MTDGRPSKGAAFFAGSRFPFTTASVLPAGYALAWYWILRGSPPVLLTLLALGGVLFLHLGANTLNDYFDWVGSDQVNRHAGTFSGGSRHLVEGILARKVFLVMSGLFFGLALAAGLVLAFAGRPLVFLVGGLGAAAGLLYSTRPFSLQSRGLGEILIFFAFGPLVTWGMGYVFTAGLSWEFFLLGLPNGFAVTAILWINEFPDFEADLRSGKRNLVVRMGLAPARIGYLALLTGFFGSVVLLWMEGLLPLLSMSVLLLLPLAALLIRSVWSRYRDPAALAPVQGGTIAFQALSSVLLTATLFGFFC